MEDCRKLNIKDLHALHSSSKIIRMIELKKKRDGRDIRNSWERRLFWWGNLNQSPRLRGEDNIRMDLVKWVHSFRTVGTVTTIWFYRLYGIS